MTPGAPLLAVNDLHVGIDTPRGLARIVRGVGFDVAAGRTLGIVGESGSGKTVLCRSLLGLLPRRTLVEDGSIRFRGTELVGADRHGLLGTELAMVFQDPMTALNPVMRIGAQIAEPLRVHRRLGRRQTRDETVALLAAVGIPDPAARRRLYPHELSGGMRQRVMLAIALAAEPSLLVADEPTTALDVTVQRSVLDLLGALQRSRGMAMILVTHDLGVARGRADEVLVLYGGRVMEHAPTPALFAATRHPYTAALLAATPSVRAADRSPLRAIPGAPPDPLRSPPGCPFAPRCTRAQARCAHELPPLDDAGGGHRVACFHPVGTGSGDAALARNVAAGVTPLGLPVTAPAGVA